MKSEDGVLSLPFRLAISVIVLSLALPICIGSIQQGNEEVSHNLAYKISKQISETISYISMGGFGESMMLDFKENIRLLDANTEITIGDYPGAKNSSLIVCSDSSSWHRTIAVLMANGIDGVCSSNLSPFIMTKYCPCIAISHRFIESLDLIILEEK